MQITRKGGLYPFPSTADMQEKERFLVGYTLFDGMISCIGAETLQVNVKKWRVIRGTSLYIASLPLHTLNRGSWLVILPWMLGL